MKTVSSADPGFSISEQVFSVEECAELLGHLSNSLAHRSRAGARHLSSLPFIGRLMRDPRLLLIAREFLGAEVHPFRVTFFEKSAAANWLVVWHQDTALPLCERFDDPEWGPWSLKADVLYAHAPTQALSRVVALRLHLDDSIADNGPLRVLPGTHARGVLSDEEVSRLTKAIAPVACTVPKGAVLAMRPLLIHASSKSHTAAPRRVLHIEYADSLRIGAGIKLAVV